MLDAINMYCKNYIYGGRNDSLRMRNIVRNNIHIMPLVALLVSGVVILICSFLGCSKKSNEPVQSEVKEILISIDQISLQVGENYQLTATAYGHNGDTLPDYSFSWRSSDEQVVKVDQFGMVRVMGEGIAYVFAFGSHGITSNPCTVIAQNKYKLVWSNSAECTFIEFNSIGDLVLTSSHYLDFDNIVTVWNCSTGSKLWQVPGHSASFNSEGNKVVLGVSGAGETTVQVRNALDGALIWYGKQLSELSEWWSCYVQGAAFDPTGELVATAANGVHYFTNDKYGTISIWDSNTGNLLWSKSHTTDNNRGGTVVFSPDGLRVFTGGKNTHAYDSYSGELLWEAVDTKEVLTLSPDGNYLATHEFQFVPSPGRFCILNSETGEVIWTTYDGGNACFSPDSKFIGQYSSFNTYLRSSATGDLIWSKGTSWPWFPNCVAFHPAGHRIGWGDYQYLYLRDVNTGIITWYTKCDGRLSVIAFSPNGRQIAAGSFFENNLMLWTQD